MPGRGDNNKSGSAGRGASNQSNQGMKGNQKKSNHNRNAKPGSPSKEQAKTQDPDANRGTHLADDKPVNRA